MSSKTYSPTHAISRSPLVRLVTGAGQFEVLILILASLLGLGVGLVLDSFIAGFVVLAVMAGAIRLVLGLVGHDRHDPPPQAAEESRERHPAPS